MCGVRREYGAPHEIIHVMRQGKYGEDGDQWVEMAENMCGKWSCFCPMVDVNSVAFSFRDQTPNKTHILPFAEC